MKKEDESPNNAILHCQKKLQRIRAFIYILILIAIVRIAMMDFNGVSTRMCIDVAVMLFIIGLTLVCAKRTHAENSNKPYAMPKKRKKDAKRPPRSYDCHT